MTPFEIIILVIYYLFAVGYVYIDTIALKNERTVTSLSVLFAAVTIGVVIFPLTFAADIWEKLNKEK